jgi:hypothetical protein
LSDVPGATVPASRLSTVLENIEQDKKLSANAFEYLRQQGYLALLSLASGESNYQEFSNLARVEQGRRESAAAEVRQKEEAERLRAIAESAAKEAARTAEYERQRRIQESDPKYVAKMKNQRLRARYGGCKPEPQKFPSPSHHPLAGVDPTVVSPAAIELIRAIDSKQVGCFRIREI